MPPALQGKTPDPLKLTLASRGVSITALARRFRIPRNSVSLAVNHPKRLPGVRARIEKELAA